MNKGLLFTHCRSDEYGVKNSQGADEPAYSSPFSRKDFTQHQLFAILVLRQFFKTDYRGIYRFLEDLADLHEVLGLEKVPHAIQCRT